MASRPTVDSFAESDSALKSRPPTSFLADGFGVSQPVVNFFNWVLSNLYEWVRYLDASSGRGESFEVAFSSTRRLIQLPFTLSQGEDKKTQISISKKEDGNVDPGSSAVEQTFNADGVQINVRSGVFTSPKFSIVGATDNEASYRYASGDLHIEFEGSVPSNHFDSVSIVRNSIELVNLSFNESDIEQISISGSLSTELTLDTSGFDSSSGLFKIDTNGVGYYEGGNFKKFTASGTAFSGSTDLESPDLYNGAFEPVGDPTGGIVLENSSTPVVFNGNIYSTGSGEYLIKHNLETGRRERVGNLNFWGTSSENEIFNLTVLGNTLYGYGRETNAFYTINENTGSATRIGNQPINSVGRTIGVNFTAVLNGVIYLDDDEDLYSLSTSTGQVTLIGSLDLFPELIDSLWSFNGSLYAHSNRSEFRGVIWRVNISAGTITTIRLSQDISTIHGTFEYNGSIHVHDNTNNVFRINVTTGAVTSFPFVKITTRRGDFLPLGGSIYFYGGGINQVQLYKSIDTDLSYVDNYSETGNLISSGVNDYDTTVSSRRGSLNADYSTTSDSFSYSQLYNWSSSTGNRFYITGKATDVTQGSIYSGYITSQTGTAISSGLYRLSANASPTLPPTLFLSTNNVSVGGSPDHLTSGSGKFYYVNNEDVTGNNGTQVYEVSNDASSNSLVFTSPTAIRGMEVVGNKLYILSDNLYSLSVLEGDSTRFTWEQTNPITTAGMVNFIFKRSGSMIPAVVFNVVDTDHYSIQTYADVDYVNIARGVSTNDNILIRRV